MSLLCYLNSRAAVKSVAETRHTGPLSFLATAKLVDANASNGNGASQCEFAV